MELDEAGIHDASSHRLFIPEEELVEEVPLVGTLVLAAVDAAVF